MVLRNNDLVLRYECDQTEHQDIYEAVMPESLINRIVVNDEQVSMLDEDYEPLFIEKKANSICAI